MKFTFREIRPCAIQYTMVQYEILPRFVLLSDEGKIIHAPRMGSNPQPSLLQYIKYFHFLVLVTRQSSASSFVTKHIMLLKFGGKWRIEAECLNTRFPSPLCLHCHICGIQYEADK